MQPYTLITDTETFAFSAENPTGARSGGIPGENVKLRPNIKIATGETAVLADLDCRITVENRGKEDQWLYYMITGCRMPLPENIGYFHASYRQAHPIEKGRTYTIIDGVEGKGQFVGVTLAAGMNGPNTCWVEGEARMYLDGEDVPSIHYTGTEDYFCGSYGFGNDILIKKYQTYKGLYSGLFAIMGDNDAWYEGQQRFLLYRFHLKDPIHFSSGFRMTLDNLGWTGSRYDDYTSVAYWYQTLPGKPLPALPSDDELNMK